MVTPKNFLFFFNYFPSLIEMYHVLNKANTYVVNIQHRMRGKECTDRGLSQINGRRRQRRSGGGKRKGSGFRGGDGAKGLGPPCMHGGVKFNPRVIIVPPKSKKGQKKKKNHLIIIFDLSWKQVIHLSYIIMSVLLNVKIAQNIKKSLFHLDKYPVYGWFQNATHVNAK